MSNPGSEWAVVKTIETSPGEIGEVTLKRGTAVAMRRYLVALATRYMLKFRRDRSVFFGGYFADPSTGETYNIVAKGHSLFENPSRHTVPRQNPGRRTVVNYYTVEVPSDYSEDPRERANIAINAAREQARTYVMPANWSIVWDRGEYVRVKREHYAKNPSGPLSVGVRLIVGRTEAALNWLEEHLDPGWQVSNTEYMVDTRLLQRILKAASRDGLGPADLKTKSI